MDISKIKVGNTAYDVKDSSARNQSIHYLANVSGTVGTKSKNRTIWSGTAAGVTALYTGLVIAIKTPTAGVNAGIGLDVNNLGEHPVIMNADTLVTTHYDVGAILLLVYDSDDTASILVNETLTSYTGCWKLFDYDSNTKNSAGSTNKTGTKMYMVAAASLSSSTTTYSNSNCYIGTDNCLYSGGSKVLTSYTELYTGTVTGIKIGTSSAYTPTSGTVTLPAYPTTLPASDVSAWAKAASKPSYTLSEVGVSMSVVNLTSSSADDIFSTCSITGSGNAGKTLTIIYTNNSGSDRRIIVLASQYKTPDGNGITLTCPNGGYCEVSYLNIGGTIYARGQ